MTGNGTVERIFTAPEAEAEMCERSEVEAVERGGLRGDRYCSENESGTFVRWGEGEARPDGYDLTLIEQEAIEAIERDVGIELAPGEHRRNQRRSAQSSRRRAVPDRRRRLPGRAAV